MEGAKRKIEDEIELAKQRAQEIAARLINSAESKRPRLDSTTASADLSSNSASHASFPVSYAVQTSQYNNLPGSKKIIIPNAKVGVIIGRGGDTIKNLQLRSGARIQITRDSDADPNALMRDVELMGTQEQISRAEELINEVIAESDAASSATSGNRGINPVQAGAEQFVMKVPNDKVSLIIGKGGETIKNMQSKSGARIQVVPLHLPPGDSSKERNVFISGTQEQVDSAKELINEVISGNRSKVLSGSSGYTQPSYPPSGGWAPQGQPPAQQPPAYGYSQPGTYPMPPPSYYGGYPSQQAGWEQSTNPAAPTPAPASQPGYAMYGQQTQPTSTPPNMSYNYAGTGYNYSQGYTQQPSSYGQDADQQKPYSNPAYGSSTAPSQPDGSTITQTSQPEGSTTQPQPSPYGTGYNQPGAAPTNGYGTYPSYSTSQTAPAAYNQTGYAQPGYGQQQSGQVQAQATYSYYGQTGYPQPDPTGYYQNAYSHMQPPGQNQTASGYGADGGDSNTGNGAAAAAAPQESDKS